MAEDDDQRVGPGPIQEQPETPEPSPAPTTGYTPPPDVGKPETPPDPQGATNAPPNYGIPPIPATPPVTTGSYSPEPTTVKRAEPVQKTTYSRDDIIGMMQKAQEESKREWDDYIKMQAPLNRRMLQMLQEPPPPVPQAPQTPAPPSEKENADILRKKAIGYLAVALPIAIAMGARGGWAAAGAWGGFGKGLSALVEGNKEASDEAYQHAMEIDRLTQQKFQNQMEVYKETLANRGMTTQNMMDMIGFNAKMFGDRRLQEQADMNNWQGMLDELAKKDEAQRKYTEFMINSRFKAETMKRLGHSSIYNDWKDLVNQKAIQILGHGIDPEHPRSEEERQFLNKYPMEKYWKMHPKDTEVPGAPKQSEGPFGEEDQSGDLEHALGNIFSDEPAK